MSKRVMIAPSILSADFSRLGEEVQAAIAGGADYIHLDVMDGHFVPNITIGALVVAAVRKISSVPLDVHLMIENPDAFLDDFIRAGADILTVHAETGYHLQRTLAAIRSKGAKAGLSLNPGTPLAVLEELWPDLDLVLLMSVNPGFGNQQFIPQVLPKLARLRRLANENAPELLIEVDGGVKAENAGEIARAGADLLVAGSAVFCSADPAREVRRLKRAANNR